MKNENHTKVTKIVTIMRRAEFNQGFRDVVKGLNFREDYERMHYALTYERGRQFAACNPQLDKIKIKGKITQGAYDLFQANLISNAIL